MSWPAQGCLIPWQLVKFFVLFPQVRNELSTTLNHHLTIVATAKLSWSLSSYSGNNIFFLSLISTKIMSKKILILFNWSFLPQMWNKRFNIFIYCLPSLYMVMKPICPLCHWHCPLVLLLSIGIVIRLVTHSLMSTHGSWWWPWYLWSQKVTGHVLGHTHAPRST